MVTVMLLWLYSVRIRDVSFIDAFWPFGMVMLAVSSFFQTNGDSRAAMASDGAVSALGAAACNPFVYALAGAR